MIHNCNWIQSFSKLTFYLLVYINRSIIIDHISLEKMKKKLDRNANNCCSYLFTASGHWRYFFTGMGIVFLFCFVFSNGQNGNPALIPLISRHHHRPFHSQTVIGVRIKCFILIRVPGHDANKIGHKRWNFTLQNRRIASYDIVFVDISVINLTNNWSTKR